MSLQSMFEMGKQMARLREIVAIEGRRQNADVVIETINEVDPPDEVSIATARDALGKTAKRFFGDCDGDPVPDCSIDDWSKVEAAVERLEAELAHSELCEAEEREYRQAMDYWREMNSVAV